MRNRLSLRWLGLLVASAQVVGLLGCAAALLGMSPGPLRSVLAVAAGVGIVGLTLASWRFVAQRAQGLAIAASRAAVGDARAAPRPTGVAELDQIAEACQEALARTVAQNQRLAALQNEQQAILQSMDGGVLVLDLEQRILSMNRAAEWMLGMKGSSARGRLLQEVARQPDLHRFVEEALGQGAEEPEFALQGAPARRVRAAHSRLLDAEGKPVGLLVVLSDITQLRRLESVRTDFAANVSHELRTPITNIKGYVETLLEMNGEADREQSDRFLRIIQRNADRLGAIVEDMLMLTQLERPEVEQGMATERTKVSLFVEQAEQSLEAEAQAKRMSLISEVPDDLFAMVNPQLAEQAVANLVANAIKYSPAGTRVWIRGRALPVDREGKVMVQIEVIDEGPGIGEEHLARIFERFYRVDKARSREAGGTGLGLAIVKHIVQMHGGNVDVESTPGHGSTFRITLASA